MVKGIFSYKVNFFFQHCDDLETSSNGTQIVVASRWRVAVWTRATRALTSHNLCSPATCVAFHPKKLYEAVGEASGPSRCGTRRAMDQARRRSRRRCIGTRIKWPAWLLVKVGCSITVLPRF